MRATVLTAIAALAASACGATSHSVRRAQTLFASGDYAGAERAADKELEAAPRDEALWRLKIEAVMRQGDAPRSVAVYQDWHNLRRHYDNAAIRRMAVATLDVGMRDADAAARLRALRASERAGLSELDARITALLDDRDAGVQAAAAVALLDDPKARQIAARLLEGTDPAARSTIIAGIARLRGDAVRPRIEKALADPSPDVRRAAVAALAGFGSGGDTDRLYALATKDPDGGVRAEAFSALERGKRMDAMHLGRAAMADDYLGARMVAIAALTRAREAGRDALIQIARGNDLFLALRAAVALRKLGAEFDPQPIIARGINAPQWPLRSATLNAVAELLPRDDAQKAVAEGLLDDRTEVRIAAARVLARLGFPGRAEQTFITALTDPREHPRLQAAIALLHLGESEGLSALGRLMFTSKSPRTRAGAVAALSRIKKPTLPLVKMLADPHPLVRIETANTLLILLD